MPTSLPGHQDPPWSSAIDPAPGALRLVQAFVNTSDLEKGIDEIETREGIAGWLDEWGFGDRDAAVSEAERRQAIGLREGLRELLLLNNGDGCAPARLAGLESVLRSVQLRCRLAEGADFELVAVGGAWPRAAARMLTIVTRAMGDGTWNRLKACRRDDCQWAFYDTSKNRSGKWCAMAGCGDLMKARAYRQRRRDRAARPTS